MTYRGFYGRVERRLKREGIYVYIWLIHVVVQQKLRQYCKSIYTLIFEKKEDGKLEVGMVLYLLLLFSH